jgi:hypothetical protein
MMRNIEGCYRRLIEKRGRRCGDGLDEPPMIPRMVASPR